MISFKEEFGIQYKIIYTADIAELLPSKTVGFNELRGTLLLLGCTVSCLCRTSFYKEEIK